MRRNKSSNGTGCFIILLLGAVISVGSMLAQILPVLLVFGILSGGIIWASRISDKKSEKNKAEQKNLEIVNTPEIIPEPEPISELTNFSCEEEKIVNLAFREFMATHNALKKASSHAAYLTNKVTALEALGRREEAAALTEELSAENINLIGLKEHSACTFDSKLNEVFYRAEEIKITYMRFLSKLPNNKLPLLGDFFQSPYIRIVSAGENNALVFLPCYILIYSASENNLKLLQYSNVTISSRIDTEMLSRNEQAKPTDEIEHIGYLYETKDGSRDMRYSYENNPSFIFVYRGHVSIQAENLSYEQTFSNKTLTKSFEENFRRYQKDITDKYGPAIKVLITHRKEIPEASELSALIEQQAAEEQARREKLEQARKKRAEEAEAKRKQKQIEREAAEQERKRKAAFLSNLIVSRGVLVDWRGNDKTLLLPEGRFVEIGTGGIVFGSISIEESRTSGFNQEHWKKSL